jgi:hypothetical protein
MNKYDENRERRCPGCGDKAPNWQFNGGLCWVCNEEMRHEDKAARQDLHYRED